MKRILFIGLSFLVAIGCGDSKPVSTVDNTADETPAVTPATESDDIAEETAESKSETAEASDDSIEEPVDAPDSTTAQSETAESEVSEEPADDEVAVEEEISLSEQHRNLVNDFRTEMFNLQRKQRNATPEEREEIIQNVQKLQTGLAGNLLQLFKGKEDDEAFIEAAPMLIMTLQGEEVDNVFNKISEHHLESDKWFEMFAVMAMQGFNHPKFVDFVEKQAGTGSGKSQAAAKFALASNLNAETDEERIVELLTSVIDYEGELTIHGGRFDLKTQADDKLFTLTKLAIGKEAPEIEGEDSDGVTFKLSEYRGKVVMLDFWGNW